MEHKSSVNTLPNYCPVCERLWWNCNCPKPAPIPKELDALAEEYNNSGANRHTKSWVSVEVKDAYKAGYTEALKSHPFNDEDMMNFRYFKTEGQPYTMEMELAQYKASKTVI